MNALSNVVGVLALGVLCGCASTNRGDSWTMAGFDGDLPAREITAQQHDPANIDGVPTSGRQQKDLGEPVQIVAVKGASKPLDEGDAAQSNARRRILFFPVRLPIW